MSTAGSDWNDLVFDDRGRLVDVSGPVEFVDFGPPPPVSWVPVMDAAHSFGCRAAVVFNHGPVYDLRLASEVFEDAGGFYVHVVTEAQWWDWTQAPDERKPLRPTKAVCWPARYVFLEVRGLWTNPETAATDT